MNHYKKNSIGIIDPMLFYMVQEVLVTVLQGLRLSARRAMR